MVASIAKEGRKETEARTRDREVMVYPLGLPYNVFMGRRKSTGRKSTGKRRRTLFVKNPAAHRLAEQVSKRTGVTLSDAVIAALEDKLKGTRGQVNRTKVDALCAAIQDVPVIDGRTPEQILGYDDFGLPR